MGYTEGLLDGVRQAGDPSADAVIEELARAEQVRVVSDVLRTLTYNDQPVPAELPPSIGRWLDQHGELPDWVDRDRLERGCIVVVEHGPQVCVALATASLVYCYAGYPGIKVLTFSRRLGQDADRRVGETAQFVLAVMSPGSLDPCGRGVRIDDQEPEDYHYRWRVIGQMLGIDPAAIPADLARARELTEEIARRNHRRSDEGILMTRALVELHANSLPTGFEGAAPVLTRYLLGEEVCELVALPRSRWDRAMNWQSGVGRVLDRAQSARGPVGSLTKMVGAGILNQRVVGMAGRHSASFSIPVLPGSSAAGRLAACSRASTQSSSRSRRRTRREPGVSIAGGTAIDPAEIRAALDGAREVLWQTQRPDGSWESLCDMGAIPTAQVLVALHAAGALGPSDGADGARWLRSRQADDGSYRSHPTATEGDLGATASSWAALSLCAPDDSADAIAGARAWVEGHGGTAAVVEAFGRGDPAVVYVTLAGLIAPSELPCPPMLPALIRPAVRFMERRFHSGILMVSGALTLIAHRRRGDWGTPAQPDAPPRGEIARRFAARTLTLLATFQNRDGSWNASTIQTALILPALRAGGLPAAHPMVARTVGWLESQRVR
ncbi:MAG: DUF2236 domain-containing protein, partial [Solirubrobacterales bacterium]|nr:DUF2236 domain-containing protein [Solirubrobacterales bacterium]